MPDVQTNVLEMRQQSVAAAQQALKGAKGTEARHYARLRLQKSRRALEAQEEANAQH